MSDCSSELTEWSTFSMNDFNFTNTNVQIKKYITRSPNLVRVMYKIVLSNITIQGSNNVVFMGVNEIIMSNTSFQENLEAIVFTNLILRIEGSFHFERNHGGITFMSDFLEWEKGSRLIIGEDSNLKFSDNILNELGSSAVMHVSDSTIEILKNSYITFEGNSGLHCGGILLEKSVINFHPGKTLVLFSHNRGSTGGAMAFYGASQIKFNCSITEIQFIENHAQRVGGAIYVHDFGSLHLVRNGIGYNYKPILVEAVECDSHANLSFINNTAQLGGSALYGGWVDSHMYYYNLPFHHGNKPFYQLNNSGDDLSVISSDSVRVCQCVRSIPDCKITAKRVKLFPGETFNIEAVAVGQRYGVVPATVQAQCKDSHKSELEDTQYVQSVGTECTNLTFTLRSSAKTESILLTSYNRDIETSTLYNAVWVEGYDKLFQQFVIIILLKSCPLGFYFDSSYKQCKCLKALLHHRINCDLTAFKVLRPTPKWINATLIAHNLSTPVPGVIVHNHCPFDYCKISEVPMLLDLEDPDQQCAFNRSGILCGACKTNFSNVLGTSKCRECHKPWIALIIPLIAIAGVVLVAGLMFLNLTVSLGTINGLIFYANILRANHAVFFLPDISNSFPSYFIAWLNLDMGIETCFYQGLDTIAKAWLQFLFPLYIWLMVTVIIVASHYSTIASRVSGNNAVQVLATLFLLSYAKLLRIIITIFSATRLIYPDDWHRWVWLYDGNVDYLRGKHIPLFLAGLVVLVFLTIPYTTVLLCIQWLLRCSSYKVFFWVQKLHPLFDAYTGPYKIKHRYWTGLLLLLRVCLFLTFSLNTLGDPIINLLAIFIVSFCLLAYLSMIGGIYKYWWLNLIEISFILNLGVLSGVVGFYQNDTTGLVSKIAYTSVVIALALFTVIVIYHLVITIMNFRVGQVLTESVRKWIRKDADDQVGQELTQPNPVTPAVTQSVIVLGDLSEQEDIKEPLLSLR